MSIFDITLTIINASLSVYLLVYFFNTFSTSNLGRFSKFIISTIACALFSLILLFIKAFALKIIAILLLSVLLSFMYSMKWYNRLLLSFINYAICGAAEYIVLALVSVVFSVDLSECYTDRFLVFEIFLSKVLVLLIESIVKINKHKLFSGTSNKKYYSIIILPAANVAVILLQYRFYISDSILANKLSWGDLLCNTLLILTNIIAFSIIDVIGKNAEKDAKLAYIDKILHTQEEQYKELHTHHQNILKIKHDEKNFLLGVLADLETEKYSDIRDCINRELSIIDTQVIPIQNNNIINSIVNQKCEEANKKGIKITCEIAELPKIKISGIDLSIIIGNALDNAIEATHKISSSNKDISLIIKVHREQIIIIIKNPVGEEVDVKTLRSNKDSTYHGFGILSMKNIASEYNGDVFFTAANNIFETRIVLANSNE